MKESTSKGLDKESSPVTTETDVGGSERDTGAGRRGLLKRGLAAVPVIVTLQSRSALAQTSETGSPLVTQIPGDEQGDDNDNQG